MVCIAVSIFPPPYPDTGVTAILKAHLLEHTISCLLVQGKAVAAGEKVSLCVCVCVCVCACACVCV